MDSARPGNPPKLLSFEETARRMVVSVAVLKDWDKQNTLKPITTPSGKTGYTEEQITSFLLAKHLDESYPLQSATTQKANGGKPGRAANVTKEENRHVGATSDNEVDQLFFWKSRKFGKPSRKAAVIAASALILFSAILVHASTSSKPTAQTSLEKTSDKQVLGAQTSRLKLSGNINFRLPIIAQGNVEVNKSLQVAGTGAFKENLTAPNILYGVKAGTNISISGDKQNPTISVALPAEVESVQGQTGAIAFTNGSGIGINGLQINNTGVLSVNGENGAVTLTPGSGIAISGTTISSIETLATITAKGNCDSCVLAPDVAQDLTINASGQVAAEAIKSGVLSPTVGGTGLTSFTTGDLLYADSGSTLAGLSIGTTGQILTVNNGLPFWDNLNNLAVTTVKEDNTTLASPVNTLNFNSGDFNLSVNPTGQVNFTLASTLTTPTAVAGDFLVPGVFAASGSATLATNPGANLVIGNSTGTLEISSTGLNITTAGGISIPNTQTLTIGTIGLSAAGTNNTTSGANLIGVFPDLTNSSSTNLQTVLENLDTSISTAGVSPFTIANDITYGNYIVPNDTADDFVLGGNGTPTGGSLFFNQATSNLTLGISSTQSGSLTFASTGSSNPTLTTNNNGDLLIQNANVGIGTTPSDVDADNNPFVLEVNGSIGPDQNGVYDLGSPTKQFRNLYITGQTTSGGNITISNDAPEISFIETDNSNYQYNITTDNSTFKVTNATTGQDNLVINANGDLDFAGGSASTGCTVADATGDLTCSGNITTTNTSGTVGFFTRNNGTGTLSPTTVGDNITTSGVLTGSGITVSSFTTPGVITNNGSGILSSVAQLSAAEGGTGLNTSTAPNGSLLIGNGSGFSLGNLTGTLNQINIASTAGSITLSLPQDIDASASPTFESLALTNSSNQLTLGATGATTIISASAQNAPTTLSIPTLTNSADTFIFANEGQTLNNKTIGTTGLIFSGATADLTTISNDNLTLAPSGSGEIVLGNTTQIGNLPGAGVSATSLCRDNTTHEITACPANASGVSLQLAYNSGNTITTTDGRDIDFILASGLTTSTSFNLTNQGTAPSFVINDTNAATNSALLVQSGGVTNLSIDETGNLITSGSLSSANLITSGTNQNLAVTPNGSGQIVLSNTTQLGNLPAAGVSGTALCRDNTTNQITACPANAGNVDLQQAYNAGNTITTTDGRDIDFTLASGLTTSTSFNLTNAGAAPAFVINDTNAATNSALLVQSGGITNLSIDEAGNLTTAGTITSSATSNQLALGTTGATTTISANSQTTPTTLTIPDLNESSDNFVFANAAQTLSNKTFTDTSTLFQNGVDNTKKLEFDLSSLDSGTTIYTFPNVSGNATLCAVGPGGSNCAGVGGSVGGIGNQYRLAKFTADGSNIGNADLTDDGTVITALSAFNVGDQTGTDTLSLLRTANASSGATLQNSNLLTLQGAYWNGSTSTNVGFSLENKVTGTAPAYELAFLNDASSEVASINNNGALALAATSGQLTLGASGATTTISANSQTTPTTLTIPNLNASSDTFVFANATQTLNNKTIGTSGLTFSGATADITTTSGNNLTVTPNGSGQIILSNTTQLGNLPSAGVSATTLCRDNTTTQITACPANAAGISLQLAYQAGNTINATDAYDDIGFTLASGSSREFTLTNAGTGTSAFVINDTNAANQNALQVQSGGTPTLTINEDGSLTTTGTISSGAITTSGNLAFSGTNPTISTSGTNQNLTVAPNGNGEIILSNITQLGNLASASTSATTLCRDDTTNEITACPANAENVTLQQAYEAGNTITTTDGRDIDFTLASGLTTSTSFNLTNAGAAPAFVINDTNAGNNNALVVQSGGTPTLTINENGNLATSGTLSSSATSNQLTLGASGATTTISANAQNAPTTLTIPTLTNSADTFVFANQGQILNNKTIGTTGLIFSGATDDITTTSNANLTITPNGNGEIVLNTLTKLPNLSSTVGSTVICQNGNSEFSVCSSNALNVTLQQAYEASTNPEIVLAGSPGGLTIRDNATPLGTDLFDIQNNSGTTNYFAVSANGISTSGTLTASGAATLGSTLNVTGNTSLSTLATSGLAGLNSLSVANNATVSGTLTVLGLSTLNGIDNSNAGIANAGTISSGTITTSGNLVFSGTNPSISTSGTNQNLTVTPNGSGEIILSNITQLSNLPSAPVDATTLCRDNTTFEITQCPANSSNVTLQLAYNAVIRLTQPIPLAILPSI